MNLRRLKPFIIGGALTGVSYTMIQTAPNVKRPEWLMGVLLFVGIPMFIVGIRMLWIAWKESREQDEEDRKPPKIV
jgi:hypothetical protein